MEKILNDHRFPADFINQFTSSGITTLYPPQAEAIQKGVLEGKHLLMSVPTAAGKTLVAEVCMANAIFNHGGRCLYIAPLKALASEKYNEFMKKFSPLGVEVALAIGDADSPVKRLKSFQILVATAEKVDSLLRTRAKTMIGSLTTVILDEIHFINDGNRGPTMEILAARIKQLNPKTQILALSATVSNAREMADWLKAQLVVSSWRPIPLKEGIFYNDRIVFEHDATRVISEEASEDVNKLTLDTLRGRGQVLIFVNSRRSAQAVSRQVSKDVAKILTPEEQKRLKELSKKILGNESDATKICKTLAGVIHHGVAFHHAGLKPHQRELVEENFKGNLIKVISCTPTLAAGVNLPARRAIIRDYKRYESGIGMAYIPTAEYKQCAGRAGRPQYDEYGEAILIAKTSNEASTLFERYIKAAPEPILSKLGNEAALRIHVLASVAGGYIHDTNGMFDFIKHTFLYHQNQSSHLMELIGDIFEFLQREKFIEQSGTRYFATPFGALTSRLYIDPMTSITIREALNKIPADATLSAVGMLHALTCSPDGLHLNVGKNDSEELERFAGRFEDEFILTPHNWHGLDDYFEYLSTVKTTSMLYQWIEEEKEEMICDKFGIGPGDVFRHIESTQWLLYASTSIADYLNKRRLTFQLENLRSRVRYGIKEELLELTKLKGVGRIRARNLFEKGFRRLSDFQSTNAEELGQIKQIGKQLAKDILVQTGR
ncbi:MAG TPA: DEAD/DEAH box helicase [Candidatus Omnitrophota bacterium]|nr:DEAD/DEAH box helicase [Candidatus Omnitrophota bacterium]